MSGGTVMALSQDLRLRIVNLVASGVSRRKAAQRFKVSASSAIRFVKQAEEVGHVDVKARKKRKSKLDPFRSDILIWITEQPDLTLAQLCTRLIETHGLRVGSSTLDDWLRANQITYKKNCSRQ
jgi:transposase